MLIAEPIAEPDGGCPCIREFPDSRAPRDRDGAKADREAPFLAIQWDDLERSATHENDQHLPADHDKVDDHEEPVARNPFEDVEPIVEAPVVDLVEDLQPHEGIEDQRV